MDCTTRSPSERVRPIICTPTSVSPLVVSYPRHRPIPITALPHCLASSYSSRHRAAAGEWPVSDSAPDTYMATLTWRQFSSVQIAVPLSYSPARPKSSGSHGAHARPRSPLGPQVEPGLPARWTLDIPLGHQILLPFRRGLMVPQGQGLHPCKQRKAGARERLRWSPRPWSKCPSHCACPFDATCGTEVPNQRIVPDAGCSCSTSR